MAVPNEVESAQTLKYLREDTPPFLSSTTLRAHPSGGEPERLDLDGPKHPPSPSLLHLRSTKHVTGKKDLVCDKHSMLKDGGLKYISESTNVGGLLWEEVENGHQPATAENGWRRVVAWSKAGDDKTSVDQYKGCGPCQSPIAHGY